MGKEAKDDPKAGGQPGKDKNKHHNKLMQDIEKARQITEDPLVDDKSAASKKPALEPLKGNPKSKLEPLPNKQDKPDKKKLDPFEDLDLLDLGDDKGKKKEEKKDGKNKKADSDDFDFEFEDIHPDEGSKIPPNGNKINTETVQAAKPQAASSTQQKSQDKDAKKKDLEIDIPHQEAGNSKPGNNDEKEEDEYIIIDGKRFREIQIEGEEDEFLMDDDGNIYDKEGVYIGTAKDGGEEEEEEDEHPDK